MHVHDRSDGRERDGKDDSGSNGDLGQTEQTSQPLSPQAASQCLLHITNGTYDTYTEPGMYANQGCEVVYTDKLPQRNAMLKYSTNEGG